MWADLSNYTGDLTADKIAALKAVGVVGIIVQAVTGLDGLSYTRQQLHAANTNGLLIAGYVWCYEALDVGDRLALFNGFTLESLWLDVETTLSVGAVDRDLNLCDNHIEGLTGIYTGKWVFDMLGWSDQRLWSYRPLWVSIYDGVADLDAGFRSFGGWLGATIKQYQDTGPIAGVDMNIR